MSHLRGAVPALRRAAVLLAVAGGSVVSAVSVAHPAAAAVPPCAALAATDANLSEGPTNASNAQGNINPLGTVNAAVLFVDFSDAPATGNPADIVSGWMQPGVDWLHTASYGRFTVALRPMTRWLRMPSSAASYHLTRADTSNDDGHRRLIGDAIVAADPSYDFSQTDILYVVMAKTPLADDSPTSRNFPRHWIADGHGLAPAVTFGADAYTYGKTILPHETGHLLGFPDLYSLIGGSDIFRFVGTWDLMGDVFHASDYFAWHRLKLGWLDSNQMVCAPSGRTIRVELRPVETPTGTKAVFARTGPGTGVVIENRQRIGNDAAICDTGVLVYKVNSAIPTGGGPIKVVGGTPAGCGLGGLSDAPLHKGQGGTVSGVKISVVGTHAANMIVRVRRP
jgi:M6 family metalloprotease-like protein